MDACGDGCGVLLAEPDVKAAGCGTLGVVMAASAGTPAAVMLPRWLLWRMGGAGTGRVGGTETLGLLGIARRAEGARCGPDG
jgi:hypothetical protein